MVAEEVGYYYFAPSGVSRFDDFFKVFSLLSSSRHLLRLSNNLAARDLLGLWYSLIILLHLLYVLYVSLLPFFRWLPVRPSTVMTSSSLNQV